MFLRLDAEKAFDRGNWGYLQATPSKFGLRGFVLLAILALYATPSTQKVKMNAATLIKC